MNVLARFTATALVAGLVSPMSFADGRNPGSVLVYPIHRSGTVPSSPAGNGPHFTVVCVTNTNLVPVSSSGQGPDGETNVEFDYINTVYNPQDPCVPLNCILIDRVENLTPADTLCVLTSCHNASIGEEGYLVVHAQDPDAFKTAWSFNRLIGSEMVITSLGGVYSINAIPFSSPLPERTATDLDMDEQLDFDGMEYEGVPDELYIDSFIALTGSSLTLINLTGGKDFIVTVKFDAWNDNEFPISATKHFKCWFEERLIDVSLIFSEHFLENNTPDDPSELDINCDGFGDLETGWARIRGLVASSPVESIPNAALLGAITAGPSSFFDGGRLLWESEAKQLNGDFFKFGTDDPEN